MGCDIHTLVQIWNEDMKRWVNAEVLFPSWHWQEEGFTNQCFDQRNYGLFGFLADVRNYSQVPTLSEQKGLPKDFDEFAPGNYVGNHSFSWYLLKELLDFNYEEDFYDCRYTPQLITFKEFLGKKYFRDLEIMRNLFEDPSKVRIVFGFDN